MAKEWQPWIPTARFADAAKPHYFAEARLELAYFGLGDALRGQRHYAEAAQAYEQAASTKGTGLELKISSLVAAGQCRDVNNERPMAVKTIRRLSTQARIRLAQIRPGSI